MADASYVTAPALSCMATTPILTYRPIRTFTGHGEQHVTSVQNAKDATSDYLDLTSRSTDAATNFDIMGSHY